MNIFESKTPVVTLLLLAWRNLWRHRRRTLITLTSIAVGFALAVFSIGMQDSAHNSMIRNAINMGEGHITVQPDNYLQSPANYLFIPDGKSLQEKLEALAIPGQAAPRIALQVLASTASNSVGVGLQGMEVETDPRSEILKDDLVDGQWLQPDDNRGLLIGTGIARKLKARIGSRVVIMSGKKGGDSEAQLGRVRGIFASGIDDLDSFLILSDTAFAQRFLIAEGGLEAQLPVTRFAVFLDNTDTITAWQRTIDAAINDKQISILSWQQMMPQLVQYIIVDDAFNYVLYFLILTVIIFGIVNTVLMSVLERTREFGLLRALGLSRQYLLILVFCETFLLSLLAVAAGWIVGGALHIYFATYGLDFSAFMPEGTQVMGTVMDPVIRSELSGTRVFQLTFVIFAATLATGIYPAIKAARVTPIEALRT